MPHSRERFWYMDNEFLDVLEQLEDESCWVILHFGKDEENCAEVVPLFSEPPSTEIWRYN